MSSPPGPPKKFLSVLAASLVTPNSEDGNEFVIPGAKHMPRNPATSLPRAGHEERRPRGSHHGPPSYVCHVSLLLSRSRSLAGVGFVCRELSAKLTVKDWWAGQIRGWISRISWTSHSGIIYSRCTMQWKWI